MTVYKDAAVTRCTGRTKAGTRCTKPADVGSTRCPLHPYKLRGRPSKLTVELTAEIVWLILEGNYVETAAQAVGVSKSTLYAWQRRGDEALALAEEAVESNEDLLGDKLYNHVPPDEWPYVDFLHALKSAEAYAETELVRKVQWPATAPWQAFATILERRHPARWKKREAVEHEGTVTARGELVIPDTAEKRTAVIGILANALRGNPELEAAAGAKATKPSRKTTTKTPRKRGQK